MATWWAGYNVKVNANGVALAVRRVTIRGTVMDLDITNSEGSAGNPLIVVLNPGFAGRIPGIAECEIRLETPTFDSAANPFVAPLSITLGAYISCQVFKNTRTGVSWLSNSGLVVEVDDDADVRGLQPPSFVVRSDGLFRLPTV